MKIVLLIVCLAIGETMTAYRKRSLGGIPTSIVQAPFYVLITLDEQNHCSGALITTRHVLTAAHCIVDKNYARYPNLAVVSGTDGTYVGGTLHHIYNITIALEYNQQYRRNDIGVIILSASVKWDIRKNFVSLPIQEPSYRKNAILTALDSTDESKDHSLQELEVEMHRHDTCLWFLPIDVISYYSNSFCGVVGDDQSIQHSYKELVPTEMKAVNGEHSLQADSTKSLLYLWIINIKYLTKNNNQGDSGGPLVYRRTIVGILSHRFASDHRISVFTNVYRFLTFIAEATRL